MDTLPSDTSDVEDRGVRPEFDLRSRNAFGRVVNPRYWDIVPDELPEASDEDLERVSIDYLRSGLLQAEDGLTVVDKIPLSPSEFTIIPRSVPALIDAVANKTLHARAAEPSLDRRKSAADRSVRHALTTKQADLEQLMAGLDKERTWLRALAKEIRTPGYAHLSGVHMRMLVGSVQMIFANMLDVMALQMGWDEAVRERASNALARRLFTGPQRSKVGYWGHLVRVADAYSMLRRNLVHRRQSEIRRYLDVG